MSVFEKIYNLFETQMFLKVGKRHDIRNNIISEGIDIYEPSVRTVDVIKKPINSDLQIFYLNVVRTKSNDQFQINQNPFLEN